MANYLKSTHRVGFFFILDTKLSGSPMTSSKGRSSPCSKVFARAHAYNSMLLKIYRQHVAFSISNAAHSRLVKNCNNVPYSKLSIAIVV